MNEEKRKRMRLLLGKIVVILSTIGLGLGCYTLCYACYNLYRIGCREEFAAVLIGIIYTVAIIALIYVILRTWKEISLLRLHKVSLQKIDWKKRKS